MKKRYYLVSVLSFALLASAPLNVSAEALNDSFYSEMQFDEGTESTNFEEEDATETFTSDATEEIDLFSSEADEYSTENDNSTSDGWTALESESKISYKYDSATQTLYFKASEPAALPNNEQSGKTSEWWNDEIANARRIEIGENITKIGEMNFYNNTSSNPNIIAYPYLEEVKLSPSVKEIGRNAFFGVSTLRSINLESVEVFGNAALAHTNIESVSLEKDTISIATNAFIKCGALKEVKIKGTATIGESAFENCVQLHSFQCDSIISKIEFNAFSGCNSLSIFNASGVTEIAGCAFIDCTLLKEFDFSGTERISGGMAFSNTAITQANFAAVTKFAKNALYGCPLNQICYYGSEANWKTVASKAKYPTEAVIHYKEDTVEAKAATCTETGWKETGVCAVCGQHYSDKNNEDNIIPALGHRFSDEYTVDKPATCTEDGEKSKHCENPGCEEKDDVQKIDALGHDYVETTVAAPCPEKGILTKTCSRCNDVVTEELQALGHDFAKDYTVDKKATCTTDGQQSKHCSRCDAKEDIQKIAALGHDFTSKVTREATCTVDGVITKTCSRCDVTETEAIKATGHKFGDWKVTAEATVLAPEQQERTCEICGEKETKTAGTALKATATVNASTVRLKVKQSTSGLKITGLAKGDSVKAWKSTNTKIFTVSGNANGTCKLTAKKAGTAKLQITLASGLKKTVTVKVQKTVVKTTKLTVANTKVTVQKGKKVALKPVVKPFTSKQKVTYTSSNKKVATVSSKGVVTGKKKGTAKITVKSGSKSVKVTVKVK